MIMMTTTTTSTVVVLVVVVTTTTTMMMMVAAIDARGVQPLKDLLKTGGDNLFPTLTPLWTDEGWTFPEIVERIGSVGNLQTVPAMLLQVTVDKADSAKVTFEFDQISMTLMTTHVYTGDRDSPILKWYENVYTEMLTLLGAKEDTARQDAVDVVDFEVELAKCGVVWCGVKVWEKG
nr:hypothetical protein BaRGS_031081 [Batillaria attramentaria]